MRGLPPLRLGADVVDGQLPSPQGVAPALGRRARRHEPGDEVRAERRRDPVVGRLVHPQRLRLQPEAVERPPVLPHLDLHEELVPVGGQAERLVGRLLLDAGLQPQGAGGRQAPEAHVHHVRALREVDLHEHVARCRRRSWRPVPQDAGHQPGRAVPEGVEGVGQQVVVLEAVTAAPCRHELRLQRGDVQAHRPAQERVDVLEGDAPDVAQDELPEGVERRAAVAVVADAAEVGVEVETRVGHRDIPSTDR